MKLDGKDGKFKDKFIRNFNVLKKKLNLLFVDNPNRDSFKYYGVVYKNRYGLLVCGTDPKGITDFKKFYSINDIDSYFYSLPSKIRRTVRI